jgi:hypothetical protein
VTAAPCPTSGCPFHHFLSSLEFSSWLSTPSIHFQCLQCPCRESTHVFFTTSPTVSFSFIPPWELTQRSAHK